MTKRNVDTTDFDAFDYYDEEGTFLGSNSTTSLASKRRNFRKKMKKAAKRTQTLEQLQQEFNHIAVVDREQPTRTIKLVPAFSDLDPLFKLFMDTHHDLIPLHADPTRRCFCQPNDLAQLQHLKFFDRAPRQLNPAYAESYARARQIVRNILDTGDRIPFPHLEDLKDVPYHGDKFPGYEYARQGFKTRRDANDRAQVDAEEAFVTLLGGDHVDPHYVRLGGRGKVVDERKAVAEQQSLAKGRLILMLSQRELKLLGVTEKPLTSYMKHEDCPIYVGNSWFLGGATHFAKTVSGFTKLFAFDAEKFDASIDPYLLEDAVELVRGLFEDGMNVRYDAYWDFVLETLLRAPIVRDDGFVFFKQVGTTSGHSHNTLLQSIITLTLGYMALVHLHPELTNIEIYQSSLVLGLGDDNLLATRDLIPDHTVEEIADVVHDATGVNWLGKKSFATHRPWDPIVQEDPRNEGGEFEGIQFLGKYLRRANLEEGGGQLRVVIPYRPLSETIARIAYPERAPRAKALELYSEGQLTYLRALGNYMDAAGNDRTRGILEQYLDFLEAQGHRMAMKMTGKQAWKFFGAGWDEKSEQYELRRFSYEEWLDLVLCEREQFKKLVGPCS